LNELNKPVGPPEGGETCRLHPSKPGAYRCVDCGEVFCPECGFDWEEDFICRTCIRSYRVETRRTTEDTPGEAPREYRNPRDTFSPRTVLRIVFSPGTFFARMPAGYGLGEAILFALIWGTILSVLCIPSYYTSLYVVLNTPLLREGIETMMAENYKQRGKAPISLSEGLLGVDKNIESTPDSGSSGEAKTTGRSFDPWSQAGRILLSAFAFALIWASIIFVASVLQHAMLTVMGYPSRFETTARIGFFAAVGIAAAIPPVPILAVLLGISVYPVVLNTIGIIRVYGLGGVRAAFLVVFSWILARQIITNLPMLLERAGL
jgi:hypothetical protein